MNQCRFILIAIILLLVPGACNGNALSNQVFHADQVDQLMEDAMAKGLIAGGVVLVGTGKGIIFEKPYGRIAAVPDSRPMAADTVFDIASLTKVVATTPSILKLAEEGRLSLVDPVKKWIPEFSQREDLLIWHLLTHTSGLDDFSLSNSNPIQSALDGAASQKAKGLVGNRFRYADINFIILGEIVRRVSSLPLDQYAALNIFAPNDMRDTQFNPGKEQALRCSATLGGEHNLLLGEVQDSLARKLGGVAGHAGVFSTAADLGRFCMMILNRGESSGKTVLLPRTVEQMTAPYFARGGAVVRGLGWDIASPYSAPRGTGFSEGSFGHTGYSGTSLWLDPSSDVFVVLLTSRLDYRHTKELSRLRGNLSTIVAAQLSPQRPLADLLQALTVER
ncbi:beta-lactamase family protein [Geobacter pelophilus]|uniref:Beta-lactamase family protein n=1 Tax=Geoanaerobacter pelophilus TaxID=60036 RepID=A0AAW4KXM6_9BACT|nr:serine hydrolase domain-containing protein [Geoanaerobacter pelophilus]MBT0663298.1 beta-lactamase family protein [Geoanaerobacter pelophilus]